MSTLGIIRKTLDKLFPENASVIAKEKRKLEIKLRADGLSSKEAKLIVSHRFRARG